MSATDRGGRYRQIVYDVVKEVIGRELTATEHERVKTALLDYAKSEADHFRKSLETVNAEHAKVQEDRKMKIISLKQEIKALKKNQ